MANTRLITDWLSKEVLIPYADGELNYIIVTAPAEYSDLSKEEIISGFENRIFGDAIRGFLKFYYPEMYYAGMDPDDLADRLEQRFLATLASINESAGADEERRMIDPDRFPAENMGQLSADWNYEKADELYDQIRADVSIVSARKKRRPGSRWHFLVATNLDVGNIYDVRSPAYDTVSTSFDLAREWWYENNDITAGNSGTVVTLKWANINKEYQKIETLFSKYNIQKRHFDGQIIPDIDFGQEALQLADAISMIRTIIRLNGFSSNTSQNDEVTILLDAAYKLKKISYMQPNVSLNYVQCNVGYFVYSLKNPFDNFQTMVYLSKWKNLLDLTDPSYNYDKRYSIFINFIKDYSSSYLREYEINYCGTPHSPPAMAGVQDSFTTPIQDNSAFGGPNSIDVDGTMESTGLFGAKNKTLYLRFSNVQLQSKVMKNPVNKKLILEDQYSKVEQKAEDAIKKVMEGLRKIQNSEEMSIIKDVLNKVGIDVIIIEAIKCLAFNSNFDPNSVRSDIRDLVSETGDLWAGRKPPMGIKLPDIEIKIPIFSMTGGLDKIMLKMIEDALMEIVAALIQAMADIIRDSCAAKDLSGGDYGELDLSDMFNINPDKDTPDVLGETEGTPLHACFEANNIPTAVGMQYISRVSNILNPSEICQLLKMSAPVNVVEAVREFNEAYEEPAIVENLNTHTAIVTFFGCLGDMVDIDSICDTLVSNNILPNVDDVCFNESNLLSATDLFNLNNLLDMLENGIQLEIPEINITCPTKPGYIPNPLVDRSIPQLISALAESVAINFYLSVDGLKAVLLTSTTSAGDSAAACALELAPEGPGFTTPEEGAGVDSGPNSPMGKMAKGLRDLADKFSEPNDFRELMKDCGMAEDGSDIFGGADNLTAAVDALAELLENFDFSAAVQLGNDMDAAAEASANGILPLANYEFPQSYKDALKDLVPDISFNSIRYRPTFDWIEVLKDEPELHTDFFRAGKTRSHGTGSHGSPKHLHFRFTDGGWSMANIEKEVIKYGGGGSPRAARAAPGLTGGDEIILSVSITGPTVFRDNPTFIAETYNRQELLDNLGTVADNYVTSKLHNPALDAFAGMALSSFKNFLEGHENVVDTPECRDSWLEDFFKANQRSYHHSVTAGLVNGFTEYILGHGRFSTESFMKMLLRRDNTNCINDPSKVGDLMDMNGIVKDVQDEYNDSMCNDTMSMEDTLDGCIIFGAQLLFFQIAAVKFFLKNVSALSAFKLSEVWKLNVVRDFVTATVFREAQRYIENSSASTSVGDFTTKFVEHANEWMGRKINREDPKLDRDVLDTLGINSDRLSDLLIDNNALKYILMWRMKRSATAVGNIISKPGAGPQDARSIEDIFIRFILGFAAPLGGVPFHKGTVDVENALATSTNIWNHKISIDSTVPGIKELFAYGGFKLEPYLTWDANTWDIQPGDTGVENIIASKPVYTSRLMLTGVEDEDGASLSKLRRYIQINDPHASARAAAAAAAGIPEPPGPMDYKTLINPKLKYRLVYYVPAEYDRNFGDVEAKKRKFRTISTLLKEYIELDYSEEDEDAALESGILDTSKLNKIFNDREAFIPLSIYKPRVQSSEQVDSTISLSLPQWEPYYSADDPDTGCGYMNRTHSGHFGQYRDPSNGHLHGEPPAFCNDPGYPESTPLQEGHGWAWIRDKGLDTDDDGDVDASELPWDDPAGHYEQQPLTEEVTETMDTSIPANFRNEVASFGIPIMEFSVPELDRGEITLAEVKDYYPTKSSQHSHNLKSSPDYPKFQYFFSKIFDRDLALTTALMNNFYQSETRFSSGINELFYGTVDSAAYLFLTAMETPRGSGIREDRSVGIPGVQNPTGGAPAIDMRGYILKALMETPLKILRGVCETMDPHVAIMKIIRDVTGQVIDQVIDGMEMGLEVAGEADPTGVLNAIDIKAEGLVDLMFCGINEANEEMIDDLWDPAELSANDACFDIGINAPPPPSLLPKFEKTGIDFTGTLPGLFMMPPGPFGILYFLLGLLDLDKAEDEALLEEEEDSC